MSWNYRIMKRTKRNPPGDGLPVREEWVQIVECYYSDIDRPTGHCPADLASAPSVTQLRAQLTRALAATYETPLKASSLKEAPDADAE